MFNTNINHFFQQFDHPILYWFMVLISALGTIPIVLSLVAGITYGVDFKKGLVLINIVAWTAMFTFVGKNQVNYPRPIDVDGSLQTIYYDKTDLDLVEIQPQNFLESFSPEVLEKTRNDEWDRYGFPSGHTSVQIALWICLFFLFRKRWILITGIAMVVFTIISRLYLAHHFLGDILGGTLIGLTTSGLLILLISKTNYLRVSHQQFKSLSILWLPIILVPFASFVPLWLVGSLIGLNAASILLIQYKNFPIFHIIPAKRISAALICIILLLGTFYVNKTILQFDIKIVELLLVSITSFIVIGGSILLCQRLNLIRFRF